MEIKNFLECLINIVLKTILCKSSTWMVLFQRVNCNIFFPVVSAWRIYFEQSECLYRSFISWINDRCLWKRGDGCPMTKISYKAMIGSKKLDAFFKEAKEEEE